MRIAFMGTPDFAVESLRALVQAGHEICAVYTQPDKPKNRGMKVQFSPVKEYALSNNFPVFQPVSMKTEEEAARLAALAPDLTVVAAYGQILPRAVLEAPRHGSLNVHASLLPRYRGAAPIQYAILEGERETGVSIMRMVEKLDAGDVLRVASTSIDPTEDAPTLTARLAALGAQALLASIEDLSAGTAVFTPQEEAQMSYAKMLTRALSPIDWSRSAVEIHNQIRALVPWPCAMTALDGRALKVFAARLLGESADPAGTLRAVRDGIVASCGDGCALLLTEVQAEGGKRMSAAAYLNGRRIPVGEVL